MQNNTRRMSVWLGGFMIFILIISAFAPLFTGNTPQTAPPIEPTTVPTATDPVPIANLSTITFDQLYLHPSGLFTVAQPQGWQPSLPIREPARAGITMVNNDQLSVIETSVEQAGVPAMTLTDVSARYTPEYLEQSWVRYSDWEETARREENDRLVLDFNLSLNNLQFIARQYVWTDGEWVYSTRVVTPRNAVDMLRYLLDGMANSLTPFRRYGDTPFDWTTYYDSTLNHIIRYPEFWTLSDSAPGRPATIVTPNGASLRIEAQNASVTDEASAQAWVAAARAGADITSVAPVQRGDASGFAVAYTFTTPDGEPQSGYAVLLNGADDQLHIANLRLPQADVDLNAVTATLEATLEPDATPEALTFGTADALTLADVMSTFTTLPPIALVPDPNMATPTPLPTVEATPEPASEATPETPADDATEAPDATTDDATEASAEATPA